MNSPLRVACIVPTRNGRECLARLLSSLRDQSCEFDLMVVDSSSTDGTYELACENTSYVTRIPVEEFNHGGTRQLMISSNPNYDVVVFLTQDAYLADKYSIERILAPFSDDRVAAVCGRQLPHHDANPLAVHARLFNYPPESNVRGLDDAQELGIRTVFISNSYAAYRVAALVDVGGFPDHVIFGEDMYVAAKMILSGWKVAYSGDALCFHSHNYKLSEEFRRYFDIGVMHAREPWIRQEFGGTGGAGLKYVLSELRYLGKNHIILWPQSIIRNAAKFIAFRLGLFERNIWACWKRRLSMHHNFWLKTTD